MIRTQALTRTFTPIRGAPPFTAVDALDLEVRDGEVFGFLGPNGAGKTTTVRMLTALIAPTRGEAWVNGCDVRRQEQEVRRSVGILTEAPGLYEQMSAERNLAFYARMYGVDQIPRQVERYLRLIGLWERRKENVGGFSKGMKQKLAIARALVHEPKTVFLDEPTAALDPESAGVVRAFIEELKSEGRSIFLCTHNLDEADRLCDRIGVFKTRLIRVGTPGELRQSLYGRTVALRLARMEPRWLELVRSLPFVREAREEDGRIVAAVGHPEEENPVLVRRLVEAGAEVQFVEEVRHSLEDVYLQLIRA
jgi:ABC-2 type transport system ATP-binding protein